jgi:hypothetical protein
MALRQRCVLGSIGAARLASLIDPMRALRDE